MKYALVVIVQDDKGTGKVGVSESRVYTPSSDPFDEQDEVGDALACMLPGVFGNALLKLQAEVA